MTRDNDTVYMRCTLFTNQAPALADVRRGNRLRGGGVTIGNEIIAGPGGSQVLLDDLSEEFDRGVPASRAVAVQV